MTTHQTSCLVTVVGRMRQEQGITEWGSRHINVKLLPQKDSMLSGTPAPMGHVRTTLGHTAFLFMQHHLALPARAPATPWWVSLPEMAEGMPRMGAQLAELTAEVSPMSFPSPSLHPGEKLQWLHYIHAVKLQNISISEGWDVALASEGHCQTTGNDFGP